MNKCKIWLRRGNMRYQALCRIKFYGESKSQRDLALGTQLVMG